MAWEQEHQHPLLFPQLAGEKASGGVMRFWKKYRAQPGTPTVPRGLEVGCGKGRNVLWLATHGAQMTGLDFSKTAIAQARTRVHKKYADHIKFIEHDIAVHWPFDDRSFDFVIDCFTSTDIESEQKLKFMRRELYRVLKPSGTFFLYTNAPASELYRELGHRLKSVQETHRFSYPGIKKFERVYSEKELHDAYRNFELIAAERVKRKSPVGVRMYQWDHLWHIYRKPGRA